MTEDVKNADANAPKKLSIQRRTKTTVSSTTAGGKAKAVQVEVRKKRTVPTDAARKAAEAEKLKAQQEAEKKAAEEKARLAAEKAAAEKVKAEKAKVEAEKAAKPAQSAVENALKSGVRLIDTANGYMNESGTGRGIKNSGVARKDIFLVTKLWPTVYEKETAIDESLKRLDTDYIDLLFLHQPTDNWRKGYKAIEKAYKEGKVKAIGLSNFPDELLQEAIDTMEIKPQVVQVEAHPYYPQTKLKEILSQTDMALMAWYPLGHGDKNLIEEPLFSQLGKKYGKTNAQIILRWHTQCGNIVIPGSKNPEHIRDNFNIFDFSLTDEELSEIQKLDKNTRYYTATPELIETYSKLELKEDL